MRIAVIGLGGTGSAALRYLARAGHAVVGYERFRLGHDRGSSHGESRVVRYTYPDPLYTRLMQAAYPLWDALCEEAGEDLLVRTGILSFGPADHAEIAATAAALDQAGVAYERLGPAAIAERFAGLRMRPGEVGLLQADGGYARPTAVVAANCRLAVAHGAVVREETPIRSLSADGGRVRLETEAGEVAVFDRAIVTAGPWMGRLVPAIAPKLTVTRQHIAYVAHDAPEALPVWIDVATNHYGFPPDGRIPGLKLARHVPGPPIDPDGGRDLSTDELDALAAYAAERLAGVRPEVTHAQVCLYTNAPREEFQIGPVPDVPGAWLVSGCSGHGFKFTVLLGLMAAELAQEGDCRHALDALWRTP